MMIGEKAADLIKAAAAARPAAMRVEPGMASSRHETVGT
jgi:hypothetical protein